MSLPRIVLITVALSILVIYSIKLWRNAERISGNAIFKFVLGGLLLPLHPILRSTDNHSLVIDAIATVSQYYSMVFVHLGALQLRQNKAYISIMKNRLFLWVTAISVIMIGLIALDGANFASFSDNEPFNPTLWYYLFYGINYGLIFAISLAILITFNNETYTHSEAKKAIWWYLGPLCIFFLACGMGTMVINVLLSAAGNTTYKTDLNALYDLCKLLFAVAFGIFALLPLIPKTVLNRLFRPIERFIAHRIETHNHLIAQLHQTITPLVPGVRFDGTFRSRDDQLTEIADCWLMIWTHTDHTRYRSATQKAQLLTHLSREGRIFTDFGSFEPPIMPSDEIRDSVLVAKQLARIGLHA